MKYFSHYWSVLFVGIRLCLLWHFFWPFDILVCLFACSELLQLFFTLRSLCVGVVDRSPSGLLVPVLYMIPLLMNRSGVGNWYALYVLAILSMWKIFVMLSLWKCITAGVPVFQGVVTRFPYSYVRHPLAALTLLRSFCLLLAFFNSWNLAMCCFVVVATIVTALIEEHHLMNFQAYRSYAASVRYRFFPKVL